MIAPAPGGNIVPSWLSHTNVSLVGWGELTGAKNSFIHFRPNILVFAVNGEMGNYSSLVLSKPLDQEQVAKYIGR